MAEELVPLTSFLPFPRLPHELKRIIFEEAISQSPRIVVVCQKKWEPQERLNPHRDNLDGEQRSGSDKNLAPSNGAGAGEPAEQAGGNDNQEEINANLDSDPASNPPSSYEDLDGEPPNLNPFYSTTPLPPLLHTSREVRAIALRHYALSFPNRDIHPAKIYFNPSIDTLYFPTWAFPNNTWEFEALLSPKEKSTIRRVALDKLLWLCFRGGLLHRAPFQVDEYESLQSVIVVWWKKYQSFPHPEDPSGPRWGRLRFKERISTVNDGWRHHKSVKDASEKIKQGNQYWITPAVGMTIVRDVTLVGDGVKVQESLLGLLP